MKEGGIKINNIKYNPERILNGFTEDSLKELAKRLKRKINQPNTDIIQEILFPSKGKAEDNVKIWQEINRHLRKELETLPEETLLKYSSGDASPIEQYKIGYMFTLSNDPNIRAKGEELYCQAEEMKELEKEEALPTMAGMAGMAGMTVEFEAEEENEEVEVTQAEEESEVQDAEELQRRIKTLENKLRKANFENLRTRGQLEKLKNEMTVLKAQWVKEKEETGNYRNRVKDLEEERADRETEIENLKLKLEQTKIIVTRTKEQPQRKEPTKFKDLAGGEIDLAAFQGRKALIFAERDHEIDIRLSSLGIIPIWAMEIDWNRPRRRMSTCELVLYKKNEKIIKKLDEIRDVAKYWNIPCGELLNISGRNVHD